MPLYDYDCGQHVTESRESIDQDAIICFRCGQRAERVGVYRSQFMQAETGPEGGRKNETPPSDTFYGRDVAEFVEASGEVDRAYEKDDPDIRRPNLYREGVRRAKLKDKRVRV